MKRKYIKFFHTNKNIREDFSPSKKHLPEWYKKVPPYQDKNSNLPILTTVKKCIPFLEGMSLGYMVVTSQDILITQHTETKEYDIQWSMKLDNLVYIKHRDFPINIPVQVGFRDTHFVWSIPFTFLLPKGYSALITHPINRTDLPFYTTSGVVDTDNLPMTRGDIPFLLKEDFSGVIPAGTPVIQIIPFKREPWGRAFSEKLEEMQNSTSFKIARVFTGFYKKSVWKQKDFE